MTEELDRYTIVAPASSLKNDPEGATLAVRLCLAVNALRASFRFFEAVKDLPGPGGERDRFWAFLVAAGYTKEALNILGGTKHAPPQNAKVEDLARRSGVSEDTVTKIGRLLGGSDPASAVLARIRNKLAFHWDPVPIGNWIAGFDRSAVVWFDASGGSTNGESFYRAASDAVANSVLPSDEYEAALPEGDERDRHDRERFADAVRSITAAMTTITDYFERAIGTFVREQKGEVRPVEAAAEAKS